MMCMTGCARQPLISFWLALTLSAMPIASQAKIFTCEDETGRIILRDIPCKRGELVRQQEITPQPPPAARAPEQKAQPKSRQKLTEPLVRELAQNVDTAFTRRDIKQLLSLLAADAVFELEYHLPDGVQVMRYSLEEYTARLREGFKLSDYIYQRDRSDILLSPGEEHAEIVASARQSYWFQSQWLLGATRSRWSVEMREGRPQITLLRAVVTPP